MSCGEPTRTRTEQCRAGQDLPCSRAPKSVENIKPRPTRNSRPEMSTKTAHTTVTRRSRSDWASRGRAGKASSI